MTPDLPALRLEYTCTPEEQKHAQALAHPATPRWISRLVFTLGALLCIYVGVRQFSATEWLVWAAIFLVIWIITYQSLRRMARPQPTKLLLLPDSLRIITPKLDRQYDLADFAPLIESETLFVLQNRPKTVLIPIPKRAFPDTASQDHFRAQLTRPMPPS
jgi:hypothetical protein